MPAEADERAREARIVGLAHEIVAAINAGRAEGREVLREIAVNVVRDGVQVIEPEPAPGPPAGGAGPFNPFGIAIPFILMGGVLVFLFPLVGLLMFAAAAVMIVWGVAAMLFRRS